MILYRAVHASSLCVSGVNLTAVVMAVVLGRSRLLALQQAREELKLVRRGGRGASGDDDAQGPTDGNHLDRGIVLSVYKSERTVITIVREALQDERVNER